MKKTIPLAVLSAALGAGCTTSRVAEPPGYVTAVGKTLYDRADGGHPIVLRGVNAGGWLVTENWMCPNKVAGTQTETYESFAARFGKEKADELYRIYRKGWWTEQDFRNFAGLGLNAIRLPFGWRDLITEDGEILSEGFALLDWFVDCAAREGIYTILDLHAAPGSQNGRDHSGETRFAKTFHEEKWLDLSCKLWTAVATHYRDNRWVAAYGLANEPEGQPKGLTTAPNVEKGLDALYRAVRAVDSRHLVMVGACWDPCHLPPPSKYGWKNVAYEYHFYAWGQEKDPKGIIDNLRMHRDRERETGHGVPVYVGECTFFANEAWKDCLQLMEDEGWSWTLWTGKNMQGNGNWGLWNYRAHSPDVDALASDDYETVKAKWAALSAPGAFVENTAITSVIRERVRGQESGVRGQ